MAARASRNVPRHSYDKIPAIALGDDSHADIDIGDEDDLYSDW